MNTFWSFLGHGGFKLLIFAFIIGGNILKARAKTAKKREAELRGNTGIRDFSTDEAKPSAVKPAQSAPPTETSPITPSPSKPTSKPTTSTSASPWSSNQNPFN